MKTGYDDLRQNTTHKGGLTMKFAQSLTKVKDLFDLFKKQENEDKAQKRKRILILIAVILTAVLLVVGIVLLVRKLKKRRKEKEAAAEAEEFYSTDPDADEFDEEEFEE